MLSDDPDVWHRLRDAGGALVEIRPDAPAAVTLGAAVVALVLVGWRPVWRWTRNAVTIAHEGGHALVALLVGRRLSGIRLHSDTSGLTVSVGRPYGPGMVATGFAGYVAPSLLGLGGAALVAAGRITLLLWTVVVALVAMLLMIRNFYGALTVLVVGGAVFAVAWYAGPPTQAAFAVFAAWFLLLGGVRPVTELQAKRRHGRARDSDADQLGRLTGVPGIVWVGLFLAVALGALLGGGYLLVTPLLS